MAFDSSTWTEAQAATAEPQRWRNWWRAQWQAVAECRICGATKAMAAGEVYASHCKTYPSKESALAAAKLDDNYGRDLVGAYPEGERP